jgi:hypothetical protein
MGICRSLSTAVRLHSVQAVRLHAPSLGRATQTLLPRLDRAHHCAWAVIRGGRRFGLPPNLFVVGGISGFNRAVEFGASLSVVCGQLRILKRAPRNIIALRTWIALYGVPCG